MIYNAYQLVFNTGMFAADFQECNKGVAGEKTLPYLKVFFNASHQEWRLSLQNETVAPYGVSHNTTANPYNGYPHQDTVDAIANLTTNMASDREAITQLAATVARLTTEITTMND